MRKRTLQRRIRPIQKLEDRTEMLLDRLTDALEIFQHKDKNAGEQAALIAICIFVDDFGVPFDLLEPVNSVIEAIYDAQTRVGNATPASEARLMGTASALMSALMEDDMEHCSENDAAIAIQRATKGAIAAMRVKQYRKRINARSAPQSARVMYDHVLESTRRAIKSLHDPANRRGLILNSASEMLIVGKKV